MGILLSNNDFIGNYSIPQNIYTKELLDYYIDENEEPILYGLLGVDLANLFIADLSNGVPQSARFLAIYNAFAYNENYQMVLSKGIKEMLKGFVYFDFVRNQQNESEISGATQKKGTNSTPSNYQGVWLVKFYNNACDTYKAIQEYIEKENATYPEYKGSKLNYAMPW
jgi:hypothetical protein